MKPIPEVHLGSGMRVSVVDYSDRPCALCYRPSAFGGVSVMLSDPKEIRRFLKVSPKTPSRSLLDEFLEQHLPQPTTKTDETPRAEEVDPTHNTRTII